MSIASEFDSTIENIKSDYEGLENIGADLTNIDKNIYNIRTCLDNIYDNLPKTTGEGSNLSLTTLKGRINVDDILGDTQQDTTNGYQLLDATLAKLKTYNTSGTWNNNVYTISGVTITINDDMSIKVNGTTTAQVGLLLAGGAIPYPTGTYYLSGAINGSNDTYDVRIFNYDGTSVVAQCFTGTKQVAIVNNSQSYNMALIVRNGVTCNNTMFYPMLSTTNTSDYEPYTNGASPNPTYPQDINVVTGTQEVVVSNKNKLPSGESGTYTSSGATHTSNGKGVYTINGTATGQSFHNFQVTPYTIKSGDYLHLGNSTANGNVAIALLVSGSEQIMFRSCATANAIQDLSSYVGKVVNFIRTFTNAQTLSNFELKPMICNSSTQTDFVEHQEQTKTLHLGDIELGGIGTYKNRIFETSGKNKFDKSTEKTNAIYDSTNKVWNTTANWTSSDYIKVKGNKAYTLSFTSFDSGMQNYITFLDTNKDFISGGAGTPMTNLSRTITTPSNCNYIVFGYRNDKNAKNCMLNEGSTALPYEPYGSDKWYIEKKIGHKKASEITENDIGGVGGSQSVYFTSSFTNVIANRTLQVYSNVQTWKNTTDTEWNTLNGNYIGVLFNVQQIYINKTASTKSELITWLNSINFEMYYVLSTPTYEEITNTTLIKELNELEKMMSYNGQTNISVTGSLPMLLSVSALKGE